MNLTIKLFATLRTRAGANQLSLTLPTDQPTVQDLLTEISQQYPDLAASVKSVLVAVNHQYAFPDQPLTPTDEIALFPPVSGG